MEIIFFFFIVFVEFFFSFFPDMSVLERTKILGAVRIFNKLYVYKCPFAIDNINDIKVCFGITKKYLKQM